MGLKAYEFTKHAVDLVFMAVAVLALVQAYLRLKANKDVKDKMGDLHLNQITKSLQKDESNNDTE